MPDQHGTLDAPLLPGVWLETLPRGQGGPARWAHLNPEPTVTCRGRMRPAGVLLGPVSQLPGGQAGPSQGGTLHCLPKE